MLLDGIEERCCCPHSIWDLWAEAVRPNRTCWRAAKVGERPSQTEKTNGCRQPLPVREEKNGAKSWLTPDFVRPDPDAWERPEQHTCLRRGTFVKVADGHATMSLKFHTAYLVS